MIVYLKQKMYILLRYVSVTLLHLQFLVYLILPLDEILSEEHVPAPLQLLCTVTSRLLQLRHECTRVFGSLLHPT